MLTLVLSAAMSLLQPTPPPAASPAAMSPSEQQQLRQALDRGTMLFDFDQAAWHTTDALRASLSQQQAALIRGWVVTEQAGNYKVTYFGRDADRYFAVYSAWWDGEKAVAGRAAPSDSNEPLSPEQLQLARALDLTRPLAEKKPQCGPARLNSVVLPGRTAQDPVSVYFMTPQPKLNSFPFGGHYRFDVKDGRVVGERAFAKSCIALPVPTPRPAALMMTHLLDPVPTEIHVFNMLGIKLPVVVAVPDGRIYSVEAPGGEPRVRLVDRKP